MWLNAAGSLGAWMTILVSKYLLLELNLVHWWILPEPGRGLSQGSASWELRSMTQLSGRRLSSQGPFCHPRRAGHTEGPNHQAWSCVRVMIIAGESNQGQTQPSDYWAAPMWWNRFKIRLGSLSVGGVWINRVNGQTWTWLWLSWELTIWWHSSLGRGWADMRLQAHEQGWWEAPGSRPLKPVIALRAQTTEEDKLFAEVSKLSLRFQIGIEVWGLDWSFKLC